MDELLIKVPITHKSKRPVVPVSDNKTDATTKWAVSVCRFLGNEWGLNWLKSKQKTKFISYYM